MPTTAAAIAATTRTSQPADRGGCGGSVASADVRARAVASLVGRGSRSNALRRRRSTSADIVHLVFGPQILERARQSRIHGSGRDSEQLGDTARRVAEPVAKEDHEPAPQREARDRRE